MVLLALSALTLVSPATIYAATAGPMPRAQALQLARDGVSDEIIRELKTLATRGDSTALATRVEVLLSDASLEPAARERALETGTFLLGDLPPEQKARQVLRQISQLEPQTWVWLEEGGHRVSVPLYDPAAAARVSERAWLAREAEARFSNKLETAAPGLVDDLARASLAERTGVISAIAHAPAAQLLHSKSSILAALDQGAAVGWYAAEVAARTGDSEIALAAIEHAEPREALDMLDALGDRLAPRDILPLLRHSLRSPALASHSLFVLARLAPVSPAALSQIWQELEDEENGGSAAAALARLSSPEAAMRAAAVTVDPDRDDALRRRALLALCLDNGDAAQRHLQLLMQSLGDSNLGQKASQCARH